jgi:mannose/fructose-specific phosphotransferase system component IIA
MMMNRSPRGVVVGHADFAAGIVSAVEAITGNGAALIAVSNAGLGVTGIESVVGGILDETGVRVIFTDLPAGSAATAARRLQRRYPDLIVLAGINLATLLGFAQDTGAAPNGQLQEHARAAFERGKATMLTFGENRVD